MPAEFPTNRVEQWPDLLRAWASMGASMRASRLSSAADWNATRRMMDVVRPKLAAEAKQLEKLLAKSREKLAPLEDPFDVDLGLHRWLDADREEAYSDWLAWVVQRARTPSRVFKLFGLPAPPDPLLDHQRVEVQRECCVPHGHIDQEGRLDVVIRYGDRAMIVVETKKGRAEDADTAKHAGYKLWLEGQDCLHKSSVLLAVSAEDDVYEGFTFVSWANLCIEMRLLAMALKDEPHFRLTAAMVLAFVAAVEQNLLGFSSAFVRNVCKGQVAFFNAKIVDHIELFVRESEV